MRQTLFRRIAVSFLAVAIGWAAGGAYYLLAAPRLSGFGRATDVEAILFWTAIFTLVAWVVAVIPLVYFYSNSGRVLALPWAPLTGALCGWLLFLLLAGWWTGFWRHALYGLHAIVIGAVSSLVFALLTRRNQKTGA